MGLPLIKGALSGLKLFLTTESLLKMLKALFVLEIFTFLPCLFGYVEKRLGKKVRLIPKFMTSQTGQQIINIHTLPNISRSEGNQAMKFGQLIKYNVRNIFLRK